jgi:hypothetical protein
MEITSPDIVSHHFYAVVSPDGKFFAGYDPEQGKAAFTENPLDAKLFTNKYEIKLRPQETLVEYTVELSKSNTVLSNQFRPKKRATPPHKLQAAPAVL